MRLRLDRAALIASLVAGGVGGCFSFGDDSSKSQGCTVCDQQGPIPQNASGGTGSDGCVHWACNEGFTECGGGAVCGTDTLHDGHNCGACGNDCGGGSCTEGSCHPVTVLADGLADQFGSPAVRGVAVDAEYVYVATTTIGIQRVPKAGGDLTTFALVPPFESSATAPMAVDASGVYWVDGTNLETATAPLESPTVLVAGVGLLPSPLILDAEYVYWVTSGDLQTSPQADAGVYDAGAYLGNVWRVPKAGGTAEVLGSLSNVQVYPNGHPLAVSQGRVAFADVTSVDVITPGAGPAAAIAWTSPGIGSLTADDGAVYWVGGPAPTLFSCGSGGLFSSADAGSCPEPPDGIFSVPWGGGAKTTVSPTGSGLAGLQLYSGAIWGKGPTTLEQVELASGQHAVFAGGGSIGGFAVDGSGVYWVRGGKLLMSTL